MRSIALTFVFGLVSYGAFASNAALNNSGLTFPDGTVQTTAAGVATLWSLTGNGGTNAATNFIGTTDGKDFVIKTNGAEALRVANGGNVGIGTAAPGANLDIQGTTGQSTPVLQVKNSGGVVTFAAEARQANTGLDNILIGVKAGIANTSGAGNTFVGGSAGLVNTTGSGNTFLGEFAGARNIGGGNNTFTGSSAGLSNTTGAGNTFNGVSAGINNNSGAGNTFVGNQSGASNTGENNNTFIGASANGAATITNATAIGANALVTQSNSLVLGSGVKVGIGTTTPTSLLTVNGQIEITTVGNGLKFPDGTVQTTAAIGGAASWNLTGNAGTTPVTNFIGTTDAKDFVVKTSGVEAMRVTSGGNLSFANGAQMIAPRVQPQATQPASPAIGQLFYDTTANLLAVFNGTEWKAVAPIIQSVQFPVAGATVPGSTNILSINFKKYAGGSNIKVDFRAFCPSNENIELFIFLDGAPVNLTVAFGEGEVSYARVINSITSGPHTISIQCPNQNLFIPNTGFGTPATLIVEEF